MRSSADRSDATVSGVAQRVKALLQSPRPLTGQLALQFWSDKVAINEGPPDLLDYLAMYFPDNVRPISRVGRLATWSVRTAIVHNLGELAPLFENALEVSTEGMRIERVLRDRSGSAFWMDDPRHVVVTDRSKRSVFACATDALHLRNLGMRVNRQILSSCLSENRPVLHGAAVAVGDRGVMLLGDKASGKTTLLLNMVTRIPDTAYISNDRIVVQRQGEGVRMEMWPHKWGICRDSLPLLPARYGEQLHKHFRSGRDKEYLPPWLIAEELDLIRSPASLLSAIFLVRRSKTIESRVSVVRRSNRANALRAHVLVPNVKDSHSLWLGVHGRAQVYRSVDDGLVEAMCRYPMLSMEVGQDVVSALSTISAALDTEEVVRGRTGQRE